jgi:flagellar protein FlbD
MVMIKVTRLNDSVMVINVEKIQSVQATPDTVITFTNHDKIMVKEPVEEISQRIVDYQRAVNGSVANDLGDVPKPAAGCTLVGPAELSNFPI